MCFTESVKVSNSLSLSLSKTRVTPLELLECRSPTRVAFESSKFFKPEKVHKPSASFSPETASQVTRWFLDKKLLRSSKKARERCLNWKAANLDLNGDSAACSRFPLNFQAIFLAWALWEFHGSSLKVSWKFYESSMRSCKVFPEELLFVSDFYKQEALLLCWSRQHLERAWKYTTIVLVVGWHTSSPQKSNKF